jgi:hypothetical protein
MMLISRRRVVSGLASAAVCSAAGALTSPLLIGREEAEVTPSLMKFRPEIEPLVALIERTPRDRCAEMLVDQLRQSVSYRQLMAALFLAGIRNVNPRPPGFALHCVFVIHSAHIISLEAPADSRLLPLFYALDNFKSAQERDARQALGDYTMQPHRRDSPRTRAGCSRVHSSHGGLGSRAGRTRCRVPRSPSQFQRSVRNVVALWSTRLPQHWPQGDLRCKRPPNSQRDRLAACRARAPLSGSCPSRLWQTTKCERVCIRGPVLWQQPQTPKGDFAAPGRLLDGG